MLNPKKIWSTLKEIPQILSHSQNYRLNIKNQIYDFNFESLLIANTYNNYF